MKKFLLYYAVVSLSVVMNLRAANSVPVLAQMDKGYRISCQTLIKYNKFLKHDQEGKQVIEPAETICTYNICKKGNCYQYIFTAENIAGLSYQDKLNSDFTNCLTEAFQNEASMKYYAERGALSPEKASEKALNNVSLHARNKENDYKPRFILMQDKQVIGFVRVGGTSNPWANKNLEDAWKNLGYTKQGETWFDPEGALVTGGIGEFAIFLKEDFANKGIGRLVTKIMMDFIMPLCRQMGMQYNNEVLQYVLATCSYDNTRSKRLLEKNFTQITPKEVASHYSGVDKLYFIKKLPDSDFPINAQHIEESEDLLQK